MIRFSSTATPQQGEELEREVDEALNHFDEWYKQIQTITDPETGARTAVGLSGVERAAIKTFLGYYLGVGGHYTPPENQEDAETSSMSVQV